jgi:TonB family protein
MGSGGSASGAAEIRLTVNRSGEVTTARVERGTGDQRMDELFGTLAAGLQFDPPEGMRGETMSARAEMGYSCSPSVSVLTFRLRQPEGGDISPLPEGAME